MHQPTDPYRGVVLAAESSSAPSSAKRRRRDRSRELQRNSLRQALAGSSSWCTYAGVGSYAKPGAAQRSRDSVRSWTRSRSASVQRKPRTGRCRANWEGDLLSGARNSHIATLVERHTRFVMLTKLEGKDTSSVVEALARQVRKLPRQLRRSLTWDRGKEMADHKRFTLATDERLTASVLPKGNGSLGLLPGVSQPNRSTSQ
jgi:hypothetical protein